MTVNYKVIIDKIGTAFFLTIVAYFAAYIFEVSYLRSYGISWQAARVTVSSLVVSFVAIMSLSINLKPFMDLLFDVLKKRKKSEVRKFIYERVFEFVVVFVVFLFWSLVYSGKNRYSMVNNCSFSYACVKCFGIDIISFSLSSSV